MGYAIKHSTEPFLMQVFVSKLFLYIIFLPFLFCTEAVGMSFNSVLAQLSYFYGLCIRQ
jgi:hypothetical protein